MYTRQSRGHGSGAIPRVLCLLFMLPIPTMGDTVARIAGSHWIGDAPTKIADALNFFNQGQEHTATPRVKASYHESGKQALHRLEQGDVDFALVAPAPLARRVLEQNRGVHPPEDRIVALASVALSNQSHYLLARRDRNIQRPEHLAGKRIGVSLGTSAHFNWTVFARANGLRDGDVILVDLPVADQADALFDGMVDVVVTWDPFGAEIKRALGPEAVEFTTRQIYSVLWLLVARVSLITDNPALVDRVLMAYIRAVDFMESEPDEARRIHARMTGADPEQLKEMEGGFFWSVNLNWSVLNQMDAQLRWQMGLQGMEVDMVPDPMNYLHPDALLRVAPRQVTLPSHLFRSASPTDRER